MAGHPDDQAYAQWRDDYTQLLLPNLQLVSEDDFGPFTVAHYASVIIVASISQGQFQIQLVHLSIADLAAPAVVNAWKPNLQSNLIVMAPLLTNYYSLKVIPLGGTTVKAAVSKCETNVGSQAIQYAVSNNVIHSSAISIGAGATHTDDLGSIQGGPASLHVRSSAAGGTNDVTLLADDGTNTYQKHVYRNESFTGDLNVNINLPGAPVRLSVKNTDSVSHTFDTYLAAS